MKNIREVKCIPYSTSDLFLFSKYSVKRDKLRKGLKKKIGVSIHYATPLPSMSYYKNKYNLSILNYQKAKVYANTNISLPVYQI